MAEEIKQFKGTTTVGIVCKEGIILAADKRVTAGYVEHKRFKKIHQIADFMAVTTAGSVSEVQLLIKLIKAEMRIKDLQTGRVSNVKETANFLATLIYYNFRKMSMFPSIAAFLLAGRDESGDHLYNLGIDGSIMDVEDYSADGSGSVFAIGVLEAQFKKGLTVDEGVKLAVKAINAALQRDLATGNGIDVVAITEKGVQTVFEKEINIVIEA